MLIKNGEKKQQTIFSDQVINLIFPYINRNLKIDYSIVSWYGQAQIVQLKHLW